MTAYVNPDTFNKICTLLRAFPQSSVIASNYSNFMKKFYPKQDCYILMILDDDKKSLIKGSATWGISGFDFSVEYQISHRGAYEIMYLITPHSGFLEDDLAYSDQIIEDFFLFAEYKVNCRIRGKEKEVRLKKGGFIIKQNKTKNISPNSKSFSARRAQMISRKLVSSQFIKFVDKNSLKITLSRT